MARALPGSRANCPSRVSRACGPGYRFVPWAGTGPRRASSETLAVGEGNAHRTGTRLGAGGRVQQRPGKARPGQGAAGAPPRAAGACHLRHPHPLLRALLPHKAQGLALPEGGCPLLQVPGGSRQLARVRRVPSSPPLGSLRAWMGHSHWLCPLPTTCLLLPGSPPRPAGIRHKGGPVRATETHSSPAVEVRAPIPQNGVYKTHVCKHKTSFEKKKRVRRTSLVVQWLRSRVPMQQQELAPWSRETPHTAQQLSPCATATASTVVGCKTPGA